MADYFRRRWKHIAVIVTFIWALALGGLWLGAIIPVAGAYIFLVALSLWYIPGVLFSWTGLFEFHEFGASPANAGGYAVMFLFYFALACFLAAPFGRR